MFRLTLTAAAILTVSLASQSFAIGPSRPCHPTQSHLSHTGGRSFSNYHLTNGTRFDHGYFYRGRSHSHWSSQRYDARYGCTCYYDPCCSTWYYWCQPANCYYPVSYCPYRTYYWADCTTGCGSVGVRLPVNPIGPVGAVGPVGPGPVGPGPSGPVGPVGPAQSVAPISGPQGDGPPPIPAPARN